MPYFSSIERARWIIEHLGGLSTARLIHRTAHVIAQDVLGFEDFFPAVPAANPEAVLTTTDTILGNLRPEVEAIRGVNSDGVLKTLMDRNLVKQAGRPAGEVLVTARIGIHEAVDWPLRFALPGHPCVSGAKSLRGSARRVE